MCSLAFVCVLDLSWSTALCSRLSHSYTSHFDRIVKSKLLTSHVQHFMQQHNIQHFYYLAGSITLIYLCWSTHVVLLFGVCFWSHLRCQGLLKHVDLERLVWGDYKHASCRNYQAIHWLFQSFFIRICIQRQRARARHVFPFPNQNAIMPRFHQVSSPPSTQVLNLKLDQPQE